MYPILINCYFSAYKFIEKKIHDNKLLKELSLQILQEGGIFFTGVAICVPFSERSISLNKFYFSSAFLITNLFIKVVIKKIINLLKINSSRIEYISQIFFSIMFSVPCIISYAVFIHEIGHVLAYKLLQSNAKVRVSILFFGGTTSCKYYDGLTVLGKSLGKINCLRIIYFSGAFSSVLVSTAFLLLEEKMQKINQLVAYNLYVYAIISISKEILYALSVLFMKTNKKGHDFQQLSNLGISPLASFAILASIPIISLNVFILIKKYKRLK